MSTEDIRTMTSAMKAAIGGWAQLLELIVFVVVAVLAILSISEVSGRDSFSGMINAQINKHKTEFVELNRVQSEATPERDEQKSTLLKKLSSLESIESNIQALSALGARDHEQTLEAIRQEAQMAIQPYLENGVRTEGPSSGALSVFFRSIDLDIRYFSSDHLLAMAAMTCGAIGALVAGIRRKENMALRSLVLGLAAGFIVFLAIKGGKAVFMMQAQGQTVPFNPYSIAFASLLAGLFTERAHLFLTTLVDSVAKKVEDVVKKNA